MELIRVRRALLSVTDKQGLVEFARGLSSLGVEILSTGGTAVALRAAGLAVTDVATVTGSPEMLDGRVKTLHPRIHAGILADRDLPAHRADLESQGIDGIDLVAVNLYAFEEASARPGITIPEAIERIDVGGPSMIRAAAKNHRYVVVLTDPARYPEVLETLQRLGGVPRPLAAELARQAFHRTAAYDAAIAAWFDGTLPPAAEAPAFPARMALLLEKAADLRYGENPHQPGALYRPPGAPRGVGAARQRHGKELSYTNYLDLDAALRLLSEFDDPVAVVIKHLIPCGVGFGPDLESAWRRALAADPLSAFGGVVGLNRPCDAAAAAAMAGTFLEMIAAPSFSDEALAILERKKNLRLLEVDARGEGAASPGEWALRGIRGACLAQRVDPPGAPAEFRVVTRRAPDEMETRALRVAWRIVKHVRSNAIVLADSSGSVGIGCGQTSRVDAAEDAVRKAARGVGILPGTVLASDAFFPFRDSIDAAHAAGIRAVIQPGGSVRDAESIEAADEHGMAMVFTSQRAFLH